MVQAVVVFPVCVLMWLLGTAEWENQLLDKRPLSERLEHNKQMGYEIIILPLGWCFLFWHLVK